MRRTLRLAALAVAVGGAAHAGPPYATDDPEPVEPRHWELYLAGQGALDRSGLSGQGPFIDANYGAMPDLQLHLATPFAFAWPSGAPARFGYGDTEVGAKVRFLHESDHVPQAAFYPLVGIPTGDARGGLGAGTPTLFLPVWIQKSFGAWTTYGGVGVGVAATRSWLYVGWQGQREFGERLALGVELFVVTPRAEGDQTELRFNVGAVVNVNDHHHILVSAGRAIVGQTQAQAYLGYQLTFGPGHVSDVVTH